MYSVPSDDESDSSSRYSNGSESGNDMYDDMASDYGDGSDNSADESPSLLVMPMSPGNFRGFEPHLAEHAKVLFLTRAMMTKPMILGMLTEFADDCIAAKTQIEHHPWKDYPDNAGIRFVEFEHWYASGNAFPFHRETETRWLLHLLSARALSISNLANPRFTIVEVGRILNMSVVNTIWPDFNEILFGPVSSSKKYGTQQMEISQSIVASHQAGNFAPILPINEDEKSLPSCTLEDLILALRTYPGDPFIQYSVLEEFLQFQPAEEQDRQAFYAQELKALDYPDIRMILPNNQPPTSPMSSPMSQSPLAASESAQDDYVQRQTPSGGMYQVHDDDDYLPSYDPDTPKRAMSMSTIRQDAVENSPSPSTPNPSVNNYESPPDTERRPSQRTPAKYDKSSYYDGNRGGKFVYHYLHYKSSYQGTDGPPALTRSKSIDVRDLYSLVFNADEERQRDTLLTIREIFDQQADTDAADELLTLPASHDVKTITNFPRSTKDSTGVNDDNKKKRPNKANKIITKRRDYGDVADDDTAGSTSTTTSTTVTTFTTKTTTINNNQVSPTQGDENKNVQNDSISGAGNLNPSVVRTASLSETDGYLDMSSDLRDGDGYTVLQSPLSKSEELTVGSSYSTLETSKGQLVASASTARSNAIAMLPSAASSIKSTPHNDHPSWGLLKSAEEKRFSDWLYRQDDWNERFLRAQDLVSEKEKNEKITQLSTDFIQQAQVFGRIIIAEHFLDPREHTLAKANLGGVAGGDKYIVRGILFKLAKDTPTKKGWLYGGNEESWEYALKAAGHELKGNTQYSKFRHMGIYTPMQALVDYHGFRLLACPLLPISSGKDAPSTIIYGSDDGGKTIHADDPKFNLLMARAAKHLHVAEHPVKSTMLCSAGDVEGHRGRDGRYYLLDLARSLPPEHRAECKHLGKPPSQSVFFRLLRPEFLQILKKERPEGAELPLSSDALSVWGKASKHSHTKRVRQATRYLVQTVIPKFALELDSQDISISRFGSAIGGYCHARGINLRHIGLLRTLVKRKVIKNMLLVEMVSRTLKNMLRDLLRHQHQSHEGDNATRTSDFASLNGVVNFLNLISGSFQPECESFWSDNVYAQVLERFGPESIKDIRPQDLKETVQRSGRLANVLAYVIRTTGLRIRNISEDAYQAAPIGFEFTFVDVEEMTARVKYMQLIDYSRGQYLRAQVQDVETQQVDAEAFVHVDIQVHPTSVEVNIGYSYKWTREFETVGQVSSSVRLSTLAASSFESSLMADPLNLSSRKESAIMKAWSLELQGDAKGADEALLSVMREVVERQAVLGYRTRDLLVPLLCLLMCLWQKRKLRPGCELFAACGGAHSLENFSTAEELLSRCRETFNDETDCNSAQDGVDHFTPSRLDNFSAANTTPDRSYSALVVSDSKHDNIPLRAATSTTMEQYENVDRSFYDQEQYRKLVFMMRSLRTWREETIRMAVSSKKNEYGFNDIKNATINSILKKYKAQVNNRGPSEASIAARSHNVPALSLLYSLGVTIDTFKDHDQMTPLLTAAKEGKTAVVRVLLKAGANIEQACSSKANHSWNSLMFASSGGHEGVVDLLLQSKAQPMVMEANRWTALFLAYMEGHFSLVGTLDAAMHYSTLEIESTQERHAEEVKGDLSRRRFSVEENVVPLSADSHSNKALYRALNVFLWKNSPALEVCNSQGYTPLLWACLHGHHPIVSALIEKKANLDARDNQNRTALALAIENGHERTAKLLLHTPGIDPNCVDGFGRTPLIWICGGGVSRADADDDRKLESKHSSSSFAMPTLTRQRSIYSQDVHIRHKIPIATLLLDSKASINQPDTEGKTALFWACATSDDDPEDIRLVELLLAPKDHGASRSGERADVDEIATDGMTPLHAACRRGCAETAKVLIKHGARVDSADREGFTCLMTSIKRDHFAITKTLLEAKVDPNSAKARGGHTPFSIALQYGRRRTLDFFSRTGQLKPTTFNAKIKGKTPLLSAIEKGQFEIVQFLIQIKANLNHQDESTPTCLAAAVRKNDLNLTKYLLKYNAFVSLVDSDQKTPLHIACENRNMLIIKELVEAGSNVEAPDINGISPLYTACSLGDVGMVKILSAKSEFIKSLAANAEVDEKKISTLRKVASNDSNGNGSVSDTKEVKGERKQPLSKGRKKKRGKHPLSSDLSKKWPIIELLLKAGLGVNDTIPVDDSDENSTEYTLLMHAIKSRNLQTCQKLIAAGTLDLELHSTNDFPDLEDGVAMTLQQALTQYGAYCDTANGEIKEMGTDSLRKRIVQLMDTNSPSRCPVIYENRSTKGLASTKSLLASTTKCAPWIFFNITAKFDICITGFTAVGCECHPTVRQTANVFATKEGGFEDAIDNSSKWDFASHRMLKVPGNVHFPVFENGSFARPSNTPLGMYKHVSPSQSNMRAGPSLIFASLGKLQPGEVVQVFETVATSPSYPDIEPSPEVWLRHEKGWTIMCSATTKELFFEFQGPADEKSSSDKRHSPSASTWTRTEPVYQNSTPPRSIILRQGETRGFALVSSVCGWCYNASDLTSNVGKDSNAHFEIGSVCYCQSGIGLPGKYALEGDGLDSQLELNAVVNYTVSADVTALGLACSMPNNLPIVQTLIDGKCDLNALDGLGRTPLYTCIGDPRLDDTLMLLLEAKADPNFIANSRPTNETGLEEKKNVQGGSVTPLMYAAQLKRGPIVKQLIVAKADMEAVDAGGNTVLLRASAAGCLPVVTILLDKGAKLDHSNSRGEMAVSLASANHHESVTSILYSETWKEEDDGTLDEKTKALKRAEGLISACATGMLTVVENYLQRDTIDANQPNAEGNTPLHAAIESKNLKMVQLLLAKDVDVNVFGGKSKMQTPLMLACSLRLFPIINELIAAGADVTLLNEHNATAMSLLVKSSVNGKTLTQYVNALEKSSNVYAEVQETLSVLIGKFVSHKLDSHFIHKIPVESPILPKTELPPLEGAVAGLKRLFSHPDEKFVVPGASSSSKGEWMCGKDDCRRINPAGTMECSNCCSEPPIRYTAPATIPPPPSAAYLMGDNPIHHLSIDQRTAWLDSMQHSQKLFTSLGRQDLLPVPFSARHKNIGMVIDSENLQVTSSLKDLMAVGLDTIVKSTDVFTFDVLIATCPTNEWMFMIGAAHADLPAGSFERSVHLEDSDDESHGTAEVPDLSGYFWVPPFHKKICLPLSSSEADFGPEEREVKAMDVFSIRMDGKKKEISYRWNGEPLGPCFTHLSFDDRGGLRPAVIFGARQSAYGGSSTPSISLRLEPRTTDPEVSSMNVSSDLPIGYATNISGRNIPARNHPSEKSSQLGHVSVNERIAILQINCGWMLTSHGWCRMSDLDYHNNLRSLFEYEAADLVHNQIDYIDRDDRLYYARYPYLFSSANTHPAILLPHLKNEADDADVDEKQNTPAAKWPCSICTFLNDPAYDICGQCDTERDFEDNVENGEAAEVLLEPVDIDIALHMRRFAQYTPFNYDSSRFNPAVLSGPLFVPYPCLASSSFDLVNCAGADYDEARISGSRSASLYENWIADPSVPSYQPFLPQGGIRLNESIKDTTKAVYEGELLTGLVHVGGSARSNAAFDSLLTLTPSSFNGIHFSVPNISTVYDSSVRGRTLSCLFRPLVRTAPTSWKRLWHSFGSVGASTTQKETEDHKQPVIRKTISCSQCTYRFDWSRLKKECPMCHHSNTGHQIEKEGKADAIDIKQDSEHEPDGKQNPTIEIKTEPKIGEAEDLLDQSDVIMSMSWPDLSAVYVVHGSYDSGLDPLSKSNVIQRHEAKQAGASDGALLSALNNANDKKNKDYHVFVRTSARRDKSCNQDRLPPLSLVHVPTKSTKSLKDKPTLSTSVTTIASLCLGDRGHLDLVRFVSELKAASSSNNGSHKPTSEASKSLSTEAASEASSSVASSKSVDSKERSQLIFGLNPHSSNVNTTPYNLLFSYENDSKYLESSHSKPFRLSCNGYFLSIDITGKLIASKESHEGSLWEVVTLCDNKSSDVASTEAGALLVNIVHVSTRLELRINQDDKFTAECVPGVEGSVFTFRESHSFSHKVVRIRTGNEDEQRFLTVKDSRVSFARKFRPNRASSSEMKRHRSTASSVNAVSVEDDDPATGQLFSVVTFHNGACALKCLDPIDSTSSSTGSAVIDLPPRNSSDGRNFDKAVYIVVKHQEVMTSNVCDLAASWLPIPQVDDSIVFASFSSPSYYLGPGSGHRHQATLVRGLDFCTICEVLDKSDALPVRVGGLTVEEYQEDDKEWKRCTVTVNAELNQLEVWIDDISICDFHPLDFGFTSLTDLCLSPKEDPLWAIQSEAHDFQQKVFDLEAKFGVFRIQARKGLLDVENPDADEYKLLHQLDGALQELKDRIGSLTRSSSHRTNISIGSGTFYGDVKQITYWPTALTRSQIQLVYNVGVNYLAEHFEQQASHTSTLGRTLVMSPLPSGLPPCAQLFDGRPEIVEAFRQIDKDCLSLNPRGYLSVETGVSFDDNVHEYTVVLDVRFASDNPFESRNGPIATSKTAQPLLQLDPLNQSEISVMYIDPRGKIGFGGGKLCLTSKVRNMSISSPSHQHDDGNRFSSSPVQIGRTDSSSSLLSRTSEADLSPDSMTATSSFLKGSALEAHWSKLDIKQDAYNGLFRGDWHRIVLTVDKKECLIYLDGKELTRVERPNGVLFQPLGSKIWVFAGPNATADLKEANDYDLPQVMDNTKKVVELCQGTTIPQLRVIQVLLQKLDAKDVGALGKAIKRKEKPSRKPQTVVSKILPPPLTLQLRRNLLRSFSEIGSDAQGEIEEALERCYYNFPAAFRYLCFKHAMKQISVISVDL